MEFSTSLWRLFFPMMCPFHYLPLEEGAFQLSGNTFLHIPGSGSLWDISCLYSVQSRRQKTSDLGCSASSNTWKVVFNLSGLSHAGGHPGMQKHYTPFELAPCTSGKLKRPNQTHASHDLPFTSVCLAPSWTPIMYLVVY